MKEYVCKKCIDDGYIDSISIIKLEEIKRNKLAILKDIEFFKEHYKDKKYWYIAWNFDGELCKNYCEGDPLKLVKIK